MLIPAFNIAILSKPGFFIDGLLAYIQSANNCALRGQVDNAPDFLRFLAKNKHQVEICILDEDAKGFTNRIGELFRSEFSTMRVIVVGNNDLQNKISRIRQGAHAYITRQADGAEFIHVLKQVRAAGFYHGDNMEVRQKYIRYGHMPVSLNDRELTILRLCCLELTYKEMADQLFLSPRTVEAHRNALLEKLNVKSRTGLAVMAIKMGLINIEDDLPNVR